MIEGTEPTDPPTRKAYPGAQLTVSFDSARCLHAAECVRGLPEVFDTDAKPWIQPDGSDPGSVAEVVRRCPSGALQYHSSADVPSPEPADRSTTIRRSPAGRLILRGEVLIETGSGSRRETRCVLCGCGASGNQPYCDRSGECRKEPIQVGSSETA